VERYALDDETIQRLREIEMLWRETAEDVQVDAPDVMVMGSRKDMRDRGHFFDRDRQPHDFEDHQ
jgi:hypothetical protein